MIEPQSVNFDARYLYRREGAEAERERIVRLLEQAREAQPCGCDDCGDHVWGKIIELIKGEDK